MGATGTGLNTGSIHSLHNAISWGLGEESGCKPYPSLLASFPLNGYISHPCQTVLARVLWVPSGLSAAIIFGTAAPLFTDYAVKIQRLIQTPGRKQKTSCSCLQWALWVHSVLPQKWVLGSML